jgi:hypothetical protein
MTKIYYESDADLSVLEAMTARWTVKPWKPSSASRPTYESPTDMRPADRAWLALAGGIAMYEFAAVEGELLSEAADRYMLAHPWWTSAVVVAVGMHLRNAVPDRCDPLHWLFVGKRRLMQGR